MSRSQAFWILVCVAVIGIAIRSYDITARSLWFDEAFSWKLIQFPFAEMISRDAADVHPPLYYILVQGWSTVFGSSLLALRSFSIFCAGVSIISAYVYGAYAFRSRLTGIIAATFIALSPWVISYSWEARMYPLGMIFALLSSYALLRGVRNRSFAWFGTYGVLAAALAYTHYYGLFTIAAQVFFVVAVLVQSTKWRIGEIFQARVFWAGLLSAFVALLLFIPWLPTFMQQRSQVQASYWIPELSITSVPHTFYQLLIPSRGVPTYQGIKHTVEFLPLGGVCILWMFSLIRYRKLDGLWLTFLLSVIPLVASVLISLLGRSLYNDRFFAFTGIFLFVLLAHAVSDIKKTWMRRVLFLVTCAALVFTFVRYWNELDISSKGGSHAAAKHVFAYRANSEPIIASSPFVYFAIQHYATEEFNAKDIPRLYSKTGELSHFSGGPILEQKDIVGLENIQRYQGVVWVVDTTGFGEQPFLAPNTWNEQSKEIFPEVFPYQGDVIVRKFTAR